MIHFQTIKSSKYTSGYSLSVKGNNRTEKHKVMQRPPLRGITTKFIKVVHFMVKRQVLIQKGCSSILALGVPRFMKIHEKTFMRVLESTYVRV